MFTKTFSIRKYSAIGVMVVALCFGMMLGLSEAKAATVSELQTLISSLTEQVNALKAGTGTVTGGGSSTPSSTQVGCVGFARNLTLGASDRTSGGDVTRLQTYLASTGHFTYGKPTGYYGEATAAAVKRWQAANGVVSSGTPSTTGYGAFGPSTRAKLSEMCTGTSQRPLTIDETPFRVMVSGLRAEISFSIPNSCAGYVIKWGDGNETTRAAAPAGTMCTQAVLNVTQARTYRTAGTYTVTLERYSGTSLTNTYSRSVSVATPTTTCTSGGTSYPEGTKRSSITLADGTIKRISDASFICRSGVWETVGSLPNPTMASSTFTTAVNDLRAEIKFTLPNSCAGYVINWGDGNKTTRAAAPSGTACTQAMMNVTQARTYRTAGTYTITLERYVGTNLGSTSSKTVTVGSGTTTSCTNAGTSYPEGTQRTQLTNADGTVRNIIDAYFVCRDGEWVVEGSLPPAPSPTPSPTPSTSCTNAGTSYPEGTQRTQLTNADGTQRTIIDAYFVCRSGEWVVEGSVPPAPTPTPTTSCLSGGTSYAEGTKRTSITLADGTVRRLSDATFVCKNGEWVVEGSLPTEPSPTPTATPTFTSTVSGLTATLKFSIANSCAGYTITWGDGYKTTRTAAAAGTMCTQAIVNLEKAHTYATAGTYRVTLTRNSGSSVTDTYSSSVTVSTPSRLQYNSTGIVQGASTTQEQETIKQIMITLEQLRASLQK